MNEDEIKLSESDIDYVIETLVQNPKEIKVEYDQYQLQTFGGKILYDTKLKKEKKSYFKDIQPGIHNSDLKEMIIMKDTKIVELQNRIKELLEENNELKIELETFKAMEN